MSGWARADEGVPEWRKRWDEAEAQFYAHDVYVLGTGSSLPDSTRIPIGTASPGRTRAPEPLGEVEVAEREFRIADRTRTSAVDVRHGIPRWPGEVFRHETEQIGTIRRRRGLPGRHSWRIADAEGAEVATARLVGPGANLVLSHEGRHLGAIHDLLVLDLTPDPGRELDRRLAVAAWIAIALEPLALRLR